MKFLTTNFVQCAVKSCAKSGNEFPLTYAVSNPSEDLLLQPTDFDSDFITNLLPKLEWSALVQVAKDLGDDSLPEEKPNVDLLDDDEKTAFIQNLHKMLVETRIMNGTMTCKNCGHVYYIKSGIPNFLLPANLANN